MVINSIRRFLDFLAKMGLSVRDDPPKVLDVASRRWSAPVDGFALSAEPVPSDDPEAVPAISVALRNVGATIARLEIPLWLAFYRIEVSGAAPTAYGRALLKSQQQSGRQSITLMPGAAVETHLPVGALYAVRRGAPAEVWIHCEPQGNPLSVMTSIM
ncbi:MAG: hypothetical protein ABJC09_05015 [Terriglobia bacterium]